MYAQEDVAYCISAGLRYVWPLAPSQFVRMHYALKKEPTHTAKLLFSSELRTDLSQSPVLINWFVSYLRKSQVLFGLVRL